MQVYCWTELRARFQIGVLKENIAIADKSQDEYYDKTATNNN